MKKYIYTFKHRLTCEGQKNLIEKHGKDSEGQD